MDLGTVFLALRVVVALGAVFGALLLGHRWITKGPRGGRPRDRRISVVARQGLGAKAGVAVVDAGGRRYLLGVTEHAVTVLDTLGPAESHGDEPALIGAQPVAVARFEQELRTVTIATANVPVVVHGAPAPGDPEGPITQTIAIRPAGRRIADLAAGPDPLPSRRELRMAEQQRTQGPDERRPAQGPLAGSVLSPTTWRQTFDAVKRLR